MLLVCLFPFHFISLVFLPWLLLLLLEYKLIFPVQYIDSELDESVPHRTRDWVGKFFFPSLENSIATHFKPIHASAHSTHKRHTHRVTVCVLAFSTSNFTHWNVELGEIFYVYLNLLWFRLFVDVYFYVVLCDFLSHIVFPSAVVVGERECVCCVCVCVDFRTVIVVRTYVRTAKQQYKTSHIFHAATYTTHFTNIQNHSRISLHIIQVAQQHTFLCPKSNQKSVSYVLADIYLSRIC